MTKICYIAGPMRGHRRYNFDAFYAAEQAVHELGMVPLNPARVDQEKGFDPNTPEDQLTPEIMAEFIHRDVDMILNKAQAIYMLAGWEKSTGATAEHALAKWRGLEIHYAPPKKETRAQELFKKAMDQVRWYDRLWVRLKYSNPLWFWIGLMVGAVTGLAISYYS